MNVFPLLLAALAVSSLSLAAPSAAPPAGEYLTEQGWGVLTLKPAGTSGQPFSLSTVGSNAHVCQIEGVIRQGHAQVPTEGSDERCEMDFVRQGHDIALSSTPGCRYFCGMRAGLDGLYLRPAPGCDTASVRQQRKLFKQRYDQKNYAGAVNTLAPVLARCQKTLDWLGAHWLRNDLALAQLRLGDAAACRATLQPLAADAARRDDAIRDSYPPAEAEGYLGVLRAARTNLKLCR